MEPSKFVAFCPYRDETIQRIETFSNRQHKLENDVELGDLFDKLATPGIPPEEPMPSTGYLRCGKPPSWDDVCRGWPESARQAAVLLREAGDIVEAKGIERELRRLPTEITDWDRLQDGLDVSLEVGEQIKAILTAIRPAVPGGPQAAALAAAEKPAAGDAPVDCLITLHQAAAMVNKSKRTLERLLSKMPMPRVQGAGGKSSEWAWPELRPWLEKEYERKLPERFPADKFRPS
jgi:predicted DNA-binding transcriptional regulator AlpA